MDWGAAHAALSRPSVTFRVRKGLKRSMELDNRLTRRLELITLTADGVIPLDLSCLSSREAVLGPVGPAYSLSGLVVVLLLGVHSGSKKCLKLSRACEE